MNRTASNDHEFYQALSEKNHPFHVDAWEHMRVEATKIIRSNGIAAHLDPSADIEDIVQIALTELYTAIGKFSGNCRFSTWYFSVIVRSIRRYYRDQRAQKRNGRPASLEQITAAPNSTELSELSCEDQVDGALLMALINEILSDHQDTRLREIFHLMMVEDQHVSAIGRHFSLHPSRINALSRQTFKLLAEHPQIKAWCEDYNMLLINEPTSPG